MADDIGNMATPEEQNYTPTQAPAPGPSTSAGGPPAGSPTATTTQQTDPQEQEHSAVGKIYHSVLSALGGKDNVQYSRNNDGKLVAVATPKQAGDQWKTILAGALTGLAASAKAPRRPGAQVMTNFGAGAGAVMEKQNQDDLQKRGQANEDYDAEQKATLHKAQMGLLNQQISESAFNLSRKQVDAGFNDAERENAFKQSISLDPGNRDLGVAGNIDDVIKMHQEMPDLLKQQAQGNVIGIPHINDKGKIDGMHYALVNPDWKAKRLDHDETLYRLVPPSKPGEAPTVDKQTVKAGTLTNGDYWLAQQASNKQMMDWYDTQQRIQAETGVTPKEKFIQGEENKRAEITSQTKKDVANISASRKDVTKHDTDYVKPAEQTEQSWRLADQAYKDHKAGKTKTGAGSMLMLSQHLGTTFGNTKGSRITKDMIEQHLGARGVSDKMVTFFQRLKDGDDLSPGQWDEFHQMIKGARDEKWRTATKEANRKHIDVDFLPDDLKGMSNYGKPDAGGGNGGGGGNKDNGGGPTPDSHVFSKSAWIKANPKGDVNAAVAAAEKQNFTVVD